MNPVRSTHMNILQINTADIRGGAAKVAYRFGKELEKEGHGSVLLVSRKYSLDDNVVPIRPYNDFKRRLLKKLTYYLANDIDLFHSDHILKMNEFKKADIIHCHNLHSNYFNLKTLIKISASKPVIWTFHDMWPITAHCAHSFDGALKNSGFFTCPSLEIYPPIAWHNEKYLEKIKEQVYSKSNFHIVTPSKWLADKVGQSTLANKPITVIYNGIDTNIFKSLSKDQSRDELGLPQDKKIILIVAKRGQSNPWKGGNYFQNIVNKYKHRNDICFIDLGGIKEDDSVPNLKIVPYINDEKVMAKYYSASDILLYPSIADNCPLVVLEAQACGLPVLSFNTGGISELVEHKKTGYIAGYKKSEELSAGLEFLLSLPDHELKSMRNSSSIGASQNFSLELMAQKYLELYSSILYD